MSPHFIGVVGEVVVISSLTNKPMLYSSGDYVADCILLRGMVVSFNLLKTLNREGLFPIGNTVLSTPAGAQHADSYAVFLFTGADVWKKGLFSTFAVGKWQMIVFLY